ncbi:MAG: hypothetical protein QJR03_15095 [Sphaerobacter sp.]|nr:hypothetical protein [Sphaerobacter sp.]
MPITALTYDGTVADFRRHLLEQRERPSVRRRAQRELAAARIAAIKRQILRGGPGGPRPAA